MMQQITTILEDVHSCLLQGYWVIINHTYQEVNMAATWLSKFGHSITNNSFTNFYFSPSLRQIVADERIGYTFVRRGD